jgi:Cation efflux family
MLYGYRRSRRGPDRRHPLGHGRELYFWSFVVALLFFTLGAGEQPLIPAVLQLGSNRAVVGSTASN